MGTFAGKILYQSPLYHQWTHHQLKLIQIHSLVGLKMTDLQLPLIFFVRYEGGIMTIKMVS
jgi:hypothetical protein